MLLYVCIIYLKLSKLVGTITFDIVMSGERTELRSLKSPLQGEFDDEEQQAQEVSWLQKARDKLANVDWKKVLLVAIVCIGNFVVFCSISLIGAFFPTQVS